jgi:hypothetical protein
MAGRFARSLELARASWSVVRADKELLLLPVMSVCALLLIVVSLAVPVMALGRFWPGATGEGSFLGVLVLYVLAYFVALFFNTALVGAAMIRMDGGNPTLSDGLAIAWARVGKIFGYAVIAATVGLFLRALEERVGWVGQIVVKLIGVAWALATFMVVPVLVTRDVGPVDAVKESAGLLRETWGENLIGNAGLSLVFGVAYFALLIVGGAGIWLGLTANLPVVLAVVVLACIVAFLVLAALQSTMQGVYSVALYRFATDKGASTPGFDSDMLSLAFKPK